MPFAVLANLYRSIQDFYEALIEIADCNEYYGPVRTSGL